MKNLLNRNNVVRNLKMGVCTFALAGVLGCASFVPSVYAKDASDNGKAVAEKVSPQVAQNTNKQTEQKRKEITSEAMVALQETNNALKALDEGRKEDALAALEKATGKLDILLARDANLAFIPVSVSSRVQNIVTSAEGVKDIVKEVKKLLGDGYVQEARSLLSTLASETAITVVSLPMATYPDAMKEAASLISDNKIFAAKDVLQTALNTLAVDVTIIPIPVVAAQELLLKAEELAEMKDRSDEQNAELSSILNSAEEELKFAQALGYGKKKDFEGFYSEIKNIREKTSDGKSGTGFFEKIKSYMKSIVHHSQDKNMGKN